MSLKSVRGTQVSRPNANDVVRFERPGLNSELFCSFSSLHGGSVIPHPDPAFDFLPFDILRGPFGQGYVADSLETIFRSRYGASLVAGTSYVNSRTGSSGNSGTDASPYDQIATALTKSPSLIIVDGGLDYNPWIYSGTTPRIILARGGWVNVRAQGDVAQDLTWSLSSGKTNTFEATLSVAPNVAAGAPLYGPTIPIRVLNSKILDFTGRPTPLKKQTSIATVEANPGSWWYDTGTSKIYVNARNAAGTADAAWFNLAILPYLTIKYRTSQNAGECRTGGAAKVYTRGIRWDGLYPWVLQSGGTLVPELWADRCEALYADFTGVAVDGGIFYGRDFVIHRAKQDNLGSHQNGGLDPTHVLIDPVSTYAGDKDTFGETGNCNAFANHDVGTSVLVNPQGRYSDGPDFVDAGSGKSWWINPIAEDGVSPASTSNMNLNALNTRTIWIDMGRARGTSATPVYADNTAKIYLSGTVATATGALAGATVTTYDADQPY